MSQAKMTVGQVEIIALSDGSIQADPQAIFPQVPASAWDAFGGASARFTMNFGCYLIRTPDMVVLIDTGVGGPLVQELAGHGVRPQDVQAVGYTHLHGDHIAWNLTGTGDEARPTFPNARHYAPRGDWEHFVAPASSGHNPSVASKFHPLERRGLVTLVDDGFVIGKGVYVWATPGHTPGHCSITVESEGQEAIIVGDALIHPIQVPNPDWNSSYDQDPGTAARVRRVLVERMEGEQMLGGVSHFEAPGFGRVLRQAGTRRWRGE